MAFGSIGLPRGGREMKQLNPDLKKTDPVPDGLCLAPNYGQIFFDIAPGNLIIGVRGGCYRMWCAGLFHWLCGVRTKPRSPGGR